jgi:hypothetical protein
MESIINDIGVLLDAQARLGHSPTGIVLGRHQTQILESELRPYMTVACCSHSCDTVCLRDGCDHVDEAWPGINRDGYVTLYGVPLTFVDDEHHLEVTVA